MLHQEAKMKRPMLKKRKIQKRVQKRFPVNKNQYSRYMLKI